MILTNKHGRIRTIVESFIKNKTVRNKQSPKAKKGPALVCRRLGITITNLSVNFFKNKKNVKHNLTMIST